MASNKNTGQELAELQSRAQQVLTDRSNELENQTIIQKESQEDAVDLQGALQMTADPNTGEAVPVSSGPQVVPASQAGLRPETQAILSRYGVNASVSERSTRSSNNSTTKNSKTNTSTQSAGGNKITNTTTVNNVTNNTTTTTTNVKSEAQPQKVVVQSTAPTAVRANSQEVAAKQQVFLNNFFRRKSNADAQRDREYRKKDRELKREQQSLFEKLKDFSARTFNSLDPNNNSTQKGTMNFFKWIIGSYLVGKFFNPTLRILDNVLSYFTGNGNPEHTFLSDLNGLKDGFATAIKDTWNNFIDDRKKAIDSVGDAPKYGGVFSTDTFGKYLGRLLPWLGDVMKAAIGGTASVVKNAESSAEATVDKLAKEKGATSTLEEGRAKLSQSVSSDSTTADATDLTNTVSKGYSGSNTAVDRPLTAILDTNTKLVSANSQKDLTVHPDYLREIGIDINKLGRNGLLVDPTSGSKIPGLIWSLYEKWEDSWLKGFGETEADVKKRQSEILKEFKRFGYEFDNNTANFVKKISGRWRNPQGNSIPYTDPITIVKGGLSDIVNNNKQSDFALNESTKATLLHVAGPNSNEYDTMKKLMVNSYGVSQDSGDNKLYNKFIKGKKTEDDLIGKYGRDNISAKTLKSYELQKDGYGGNNSIFDPFKDFGQRIADRFSTTAPSRLYRSVFNKLSNSEVMDNAKKIINSLMGKLGFTPAQASGATGVLMAESGLNPAIENESEKKKGHLGPTGHGQGIAQWSKERNQNFFDWYEFKYGRGTGKYPAQASLDDQIEFMIHEMIGRPKFMEEMRKAQTPAQAADIMLRGFENGGPNALATPRQLDSYVKVGSGNYDHLITTRASYAQGIHDTLFSTPSPTPVSADSSTTDASTDNVITPDSSEVAVDPNSYSLSSFSTPNFVTPTSAGFSIDSTPKSPVPLKTSDSMDSKVDLDTLNEIKGLRNDLKVVGAAIVQVSSVPHTINYVGGTSVNNINASHSSDTSNLKG